MSSIPTRISRPTAMARTDVRPPSDLLLEARSLERAGCLPEAIERYEALIGLAGSVGQHSVLAEAMRRLAIVRHQRGGTAEARELCRRSHEIARGIGNELLEAEAFNTLGCIDIQTGALDDARRNFERALELGAGSRELGARAEQNLGVLANIRGDLTEALTRYRRSLDAYGATGNEHGCAIVFHSLGLVSADRELWDEAQAYFEKSREIAERAGDVRLRGACLMGIAKVQLATQRFEDARQGAESALSLFDQLGSPGEKSGAYRLLGVGYRETGRPALAESRLRSAIELATASSSKLNEAEATRELA
ncbi:MAG TPA: tetratricopeptide repeat protein, partial [Gemmatimonadaceae bacterium]|nr:tetratricopeptide repeat protein [Gemmatimonadaceae bacterium]